jgi:hypothetical protein
MLMPVNPSPWGSTLRSSIPSAISPGIASIGADGAARSSTLSCWRAGRHWSVGSYSIDVELVDEAAERRAPHGQAEPDIQRSLAFWRRCFLHLDRGCCRAAERSACTVGAAFAGVAVAGRCRSARRRSVSFGSQPRSHRNDSALTAWRPRPTAAARTCSTQPFDAPSTPSGDASAPAARATGPFSPGRECNG